MRHWKQRFDPKAELIVTKQILLDGVQKNPGDLLSQEEVETLGPHRLRRWWEARVIALAPPKKSPTVQAAAKGRKTPKAPKADEAE